MNPLHSSLGTLCHPYILTISFVECFSFTPVLSLFEHITYTSARKYSLVLFHAMLAGCFTGVKAHAYSCIACEVCTSKRWKASMSCSTLDTEGWPKNEHDLHWFGASEAQASTSVL